MTLLVSPNMMPFPATLEVNEKKKEVNEREIQEDVWSLLLLAPWREARVVRQQEPVCSNADSVLLLLLFFF